MVKTGEGNELQANSLSPPVPWSPLESSPVLEESWKAAGQVSRRWADSRRMADSAAHLVDRVLPQAPAGQWVFDVAVSPDGMGGKRQPEGNKRERPKKCPP